MTAFVVFLEKSVNASNTYGFKQKNALNKVPLKITLRESGAIIFPPQKIVNLCDVVSIFSISELKIFEKYGWVITS